MLYELLWVFYYLILYVGICTFVPVWYEINNWEQNWFEFNLGYLLVEWKYSVVDTGSEVGRNQYNLWRANYNYYLFECVC